MDESYTVQKGMVLSANGSNLIVRLDHNPNQAATGCRSCAMKAVCKGMETGQMDLPVAAPGGAEYAPGDEIVIAYKQANAALAAAAMFVPPLAGLAAGGWLLRAGSDMTLLLGCALGFAAGLAATWLISKKADILRPRIEVVKESP